MNGIHMGSCPYGDEGDRLWVKENWAVHKHYDTMSPRFVEIAMGGDTLGCVSYEANVHEDWAGRNRPSIHMPRWASRITLEITHVRVERVQEISTEDIIKEGLSTRLREHDAVVDLSDKWKMLWDSINEPRGYGWDKNPWVWAVDFKKL